MSEGVSVCAAQAKRTHVLRTGDDRAKPRQEQTKHFVGVFDPALDSQSTLKG